MRFVIIVVIFGLRITSLPADDWVSYHHDTAHTGCSAVAIDPNSLNLAWISPEGYNRPVVLGNAVYALKDHYFDDPPEDKVSVSSFALSDGTINWTLSIDQLYNPSDVAIAGDLVIFVAWSNAGGSALYAVDIHTGLLRYAVQGVYCDNVPTVIKDRESGQTFAYCHNITSVSKILLGPTSGASIWAKSVGYCQAPPAVVEGSIVQAGVSIDQTTGIRNSFAPTNDAQMTVYDASRRQLYFLDMDRLRAFHYTDNSHINLLWTHTGDGVPPHGAVVLDPTGRIYLAQYDGIKELDPNTGAIIRSSSHTEDTDVPYGGHPVITQGMLWAFNEDFTYVFDLTGFNLIRSFEGGVGAHNNYYQMPGTFVDGYFLLENETTYADHFGFDVYSIQAPKLIGVASRKSHGDAGAFDLSLPLTGVRAIECRSGGATNSHQVVFKFANPLQDVSSVTTSVNLFQPKGSIGVDPTEYAVDLDNINNSQYVTVTLHHVSNSNSFIGNFSATIGFLKGDINGDGTVNSADIGKIKSLSGSAVDASSFLSDINTDAFLNSADISQVKNASGTSLPASSSSAKTRSTSGGPN